MGSKISESSYSTIDTIPQFRIALAQLALAFVTITTFQGEMKNHIN